MRQGAADVWPEIEVLLKEIKSFITLVKLALVACLKYS